MNKGTKILLGLLTAAGIGTGYYIIQKKKESAQEVDPYALPDKSNPSSPGSGTKAQPTALDYNSKFTSSDKAHVTIMQKMIGVTPDGIWGSMTEAALPKGLARPFSLNQLQTALNNLKLDQARTQNVNSSGLKVGDLVYAAYTTDVEVTKGAKYKDLKWTATGAKRIQEVTKGQYLGKVVALNPNSVLINNSYNELVLTTYSKVTKTKSVNGLAGLNGVEML